MFEPICDHSEAKQAARRIFQKYRGGKGELGQLAVGSMMREAYDSIQKDYNPSGEEVRQYYQGLDADGDGRITLQDLQVKAIKYFCCDSSPAKASKTVQRRFSLTITNNLLVARRLFQKYQNPEDKTITQNQVYSVIKQTYEAIGRKDFQPTVEDIETWMSVCDSNRDGKVVYKQYEDFVIMSLQEAGVQLYDD